MENKCKICGKIIESPYKVSTCSDKCEAIWKEDQAKRKREYNREYKKRTAEKQRKYQRAYYERTGKTRKRKPESVERNRVRARKRYHERKAEKAKAEKQ